MKTLIMAPLATLLIVFIFVLAQCSSGGMNDGGIPCDPPGAGNTFNNPCPGNP
jgi:hypothetical protein